VNDPTFFRRFLVMCALGFWTGGFFFYGGLVIPAGDAVFGGNLEQGFVTQVVSREMNISGVFALAVLLWDTRVSRSIFSQRSYRALLSIWTALVAMQVALFFLHEGVSRTLATEEHRVVDSEHFYGVHRAYLWTSIVMHFGALAWLAIASRSWWLVERPLFREAGE
jgi:hypothetical protein